jgi:hypothetical protein
LKEEMMFEWRREDTEQIMCTRAFLEEYVSKPRGKEGLKHYYRQFDRIFKALVIKDELDSYSQGRLFVAGLPADVRCKVLLKREVCSPTGTVNYLKALTATKAFIEGEEMLEHFVVQPERQTNLSNLAESLNKVKPAPKADQAHALSSAEKKDRQQEDVVEMLTKSMGALTLPITTAVSRMETAVANMSSTRQMPACRQTEGRARSCS